MAELIKRVVDMVQGRAVILLAGVVVVVAALATAVRPAPVASASGQSTVLLELFTSQGCSSCPPADRLLRELASDRAFAGRVVPLAFHVDYWNDLGWRDPFSSASWSRRQGRYAAARGTSVYTPQLVIDGVDECVGSREAEVRRAISQALGRPDGATIRLAVEQGSDGVRVRVHTRRLPGAAREKLVAYVALFEDGLETPIPSGENAGRHLENDRVVRALLKAYELTGDQEEGEGQVEIALDRDWRREKLGVVAFAQSAPQRTVHAVAEERLAHLMP